MMLSATEKVWNIIQHGMIIGKIFCCSMHSFMDYLRKICKSRHDPPVVSGTGGGEVGGGVVDVDKVGLIVVLVVVDGQIPPGGIIQVTFGDGGMPHIPFPPSPPA